MYFWVINRIQVLNVTFHGANSSYFSSNYITFKKNTEVLWYGYINDFTWRNTIYSTRAFTKYLSLKMFITIPCKKEK